MAKSKSTTVSGNVFPHMCRDGHVEIGHRDSESELCPLCREIGRAESLESALRAAEARIVEILGACKATAPRGFIGGVVRCKLALGHSGCHSGTSDDGMASSMWSDR